ncbi:hypothetical protein AAK894_11315 [Lachnospiraceae bacterium 46-61]
MKKKFAMIFATGMALTLTIGCNVFASETTVETTKQYRNYREKVEDTEKSKQQFDMAKVTEVNGDTLVVKLAEKPEIPEGEEGERPERPPMLEGEEGERPERPPMLEGEEGQRPERPPMSEGEEGQRPERPPMSEGEEGQRPRHNNKLMKEMNFDEQEIEIALSEDVEIHIGGGEQGTINDIQSDNVIKIYYAEDGETVESIFIRE